MIYPLLDSIFIFLCVKVKRLRPYVLYSLFSWFSTENNLTGRGLLTDLIDLHEVTHIPLGDSGNRWDGKWS